MLILILIDVQYSMKAAFNFEKVPVIIVVLPQVLTTQLKNSPQQNSQFYSHPLPLFGKP